MISVLYHDNTAVTSEQSQITEIKSDDKLKIEITNQEKKMH